ncbi:ankyrin repeat domain-containing protein [Candidatus Cardinium sp. TP]|nr:ankyrin repeat domain-containing protein [Candidatus Cardinium sp. TP]MDN5246987.1 ankyrin repeat domain-containing protein [Candidatus Cardinium sp.]
MAVKDNLLDGICILLQAVGINPNIQDNDGFTPLHLAVERCLDLAMDTLLGFTNSGIDVNVQSKDGRAPLHIASYDGNVEMVQKLLKVGNINVNLQECRDWTPAHLAVY